MNQQRQPITETRYPIDQTIPHQLVVSKILGALMCHPAFRIIQHEGQRPFVTPTDSLADLRGACDIAVSLDGSMKYGVVIEAKTTAHSEGGAWKIFKAVREERRNALQFERLVNAAPRWWYLIVRTDKLTAKTHEEHDRNLLDCHAILVDGKQGDQVPEDFIGPLRFGEMLQLLGDRLHISSSTPIKTPSREQLAFPIDDVPVVTMDMPLRSPVTKVEPIKVEAVKPPALQPSPLSSLHHARSIAFYQLADPLSSVWNDVGEAVIINRIKTHSGLESIFNRMVKECAENNHAFLEKHVPSGSKRSIMLRVPTMCMILAISCEAYRRHITAERASRQRLDTCNAILPEALIEVQEKNRIASINILRIFGYDACR